MIIPGKVVLSNKVVTGIFDKTGTLTKDITNGIMHETQKNTITFTKTELKRYFGTKKHPREMKTQIIKLLDEWKEKQPPHRTNQKER